MQFKWQVILLTDWNDIFIAVDSFVDFDYAASIPGNEDIAIFDIGANIGDTAIVFAASAQVKQVFSFEPLPSIYQRLTKNLDYNPDLKQKIKLEWRMVIRDATPIIAELLATCRILSR